jgi:hypothetical protein
VSKKLINKERCMKASEVHGPASVVAATYRIFCSDCGRDVTPRGFSHTFTYDAAQAFADAHNSEAHPPHDPVTP